MYTKPQSGLAACSPRERSYGVPGPEQDIDPPDPDLNVIPVGVAVTSAHTGPACTRSTAGFHTL
ncbi:hypothetical protein AORI_4487 [Amycolatopsis keratiniphila]|uniref:Uncharacterized protein n=1 Tax=Amycolatopsis keratiniphila TaxID=129921 RepID=R4T3S8_9PSEU|nr:hypothetical protein AORI_4487 [Amycolatopsis keratiniphila]